MDDRLVVAVRAGLVNRRGVVGRIHDFVEVGDAFRAHLHEGNSDMGIVDAGGGEQGADRDLAIGDIKVKLVFSPPEDAPIIALFAANVAGGGTSL